MRITLLILIVGLFHSGLYAQSTRLLTKNEIHEFAVVEQIPIAPDCEHLKNADPEETKACFQKYVMHQVAKNFRYPKEAREANVMARIYVNFVIEKNGDVSSVHIARGAEDAYDNAKREKRHAARLLDKEAIRVVANLYFVKSAQQKGKPVRMSFTLPINAKLSE